MSASPERIRKSKDKSRGKRLPPPAPGPSDVSDSVWHVTPTKSTAGLDPIDTPSRKKVCRTLEGPTTRSKPLFKPPPTLPGAAHATDADLDAAATIAEADDLVVLARPPPEASHQAGALALDAVLEVSRNVRTWARTQSNKGNISHPAKKALEANLDVVLSAVGDLRSSYDRALGATTGADRAVQSLALTLKEFLGGPRSLPSLPSPVTAPSLSPSTPSASSFSRSDQVPTVPDPSFVLFVQPAVGVEMNTDRLYAVLQKACNPLESGLRVVSRRVVSPGRVRIALETAQDRDRLSQILRSNKALLITESLPRLRSVRISGVPISTTEADIRQAIQTQNPDLLGGDSLTTISVYPRPPREGSTTRLWVLQGPDAFVTRAIQAGRFYIGWSSHPLNQYIDITRCFKCERFGHVAKYCLDEINTCSHCADTGHGHLQCPKARDPPVCANCKRRGRAAEHASRDPDCPTYRQQLRSTT